MLIALAGPAVNLVLAAVLALLVAASGGSFDPAHALTLRGAFAAQLLWINLGLAAFNLLPAFPMDGGRALRAALAHWLGRPRATRIASAIGKVLAVAFVVFGLMGNLLLVAVGLFVWSVAEMWTQSDNPFLYFQF
jgi:Zn-dependent protease